MFLLMFNWERRIHANDVRAAMSLSAQRKSSLVVRRRFVPRSPRDGEAMPSFDQTPDKPEPFGFKISWFAVKATDPATVLDALEFKEAMPANWASALQLRIGMPRAANAGPLCPRRSAAGSWL